MNDIFVRVPQHTVHGQECHNFSLLLARSSSSHPARNQSLATGLFMWLALLICFISFYDHVVHVARYSYSLRLFGVWCLDLLHRRQILFHIIKLEF
jgi:hypothetical protein